MIRYYFKSAFRYLVKNRTHTAIHFIGLSIGFAAVIIISIFIQKELTYDKFHSNGESIYRVYQKNRAGNFSPGNPGPLASWAKAELPEVQNATKLSRFFTEAFISYNNNNYKLNQQALLADEEFTNVFTFPEKIGNVETALNTPASIVLTETLANKIFKEENPIGKIIQLNNQFDFTVNAVVKDLPTNSSINFDVLISVSSIGYLSSNSFSDKKWNHAGYDTYFLLSKNVDKNIVAQKILEGIKMNDKYAKENMKDGSIMLLPLKDVYYGSGSKFDIVKHGDKKVTIILLAIAIIIFLLAALNFINLSASATFSRITEIGTIKTIGGGNWQLRLRFITEAVVLTIFSGIVAFLIVLSFIPIINSVFQVGIEINFYQYLSILSVVIFASLLAGIINGFIPTLYFNKLKPYEAIKGKRGSVNNKQQFRYPLIVFQFAAASILIICSIIILNQMNYIKYKDLGFEKENIITVSLDKNLAIEKDILRDKLLNNANISNVGFSTALPGGMMSHYGDHPFYENGVEKKIDISVINADAEFLELFNLEFVQGENLPSNPTGSSMFMVLNETAAKELNNPLTAKGQRESIITGVVKDFHFNTLYSEILPFMFTCLNMENAPERFKIRNLYRYATIKINSSNPKTISSTIKFIENSCKEVAPDSPFEFAFFDNYLDSLYKEETKISKIISLFTFLASFIAALGLFGLVVYSTKQRTKEIGIRKVNGAKVSEILTMLNKDFVKWIAIAFAVACPIAYYAMNKWLENFAYKTTLSWWIFALAGVLALGIALLTVSWQSWRAATRNPVEALRYE